MGRSRRRWSATATLGSHHHCRRRRLRRSRLEPPAPCVPEARPGCRGGRAGSPRPAAHTASSVSAAGTPCAPCRCGATSTSGRCASSTSASVGASSAARRRASSAREPREGLRPQTAWHTQRRKRQLLPHPLPPRTRAGAHTHTGVGPCGAGRRGLTTYGWGGGCRAQAAGRAGRPHSLHPGVHHVLLLRPGRSAGVRRWLFPSCAHAASPSLRKCGGGGGGGGGGGADVRGGDPQVN
jgi:hypothetical protein